MNKGYEESKRELWVKVWCAVAASSNCADMEICSNWADRAVEEFSRRFGKNKEAP